MASVHGGRARGSLVKRAEEKRLESHWVDGSEEEDLLDFRRAAGPCDERETCRDATLNGSCGLTR